VLTVGVMAVVLVLGGAALVVAGYAVGYHRARAAADLAALSGATAFRSGQDACREARRSAERNGARLTDCEVAGDQIDFVVTVEVSVAARGQPRGLPRHVDAIAHAGPAA
jgi:secretion/DNA translocation related TadE-like protein